METQEITQKELRELLFDISSDGASIVTINTETTPRMRKTDNPYWDKENKEWLLTKKSRVNGMVNWIYTNSVNNQRKREDKEDDFEAEPRQWGERIQGTPLVEHKGRYYLELKVERSFESTYVDDNGNEVDKEEIRDFLYSSSSSRQKLDKEVILRDYRLDSIVSIKMNKKFYKVVR